MVAMLLWHNYMIIVMSCIVQSHDIFSGMDVLDQDDVAELLPGGDVKFSDSPYIAAVFNALFKVQTCTGIIINSEFVLAGGYCVILKNEIVDPKFVTVLSGVVDFRDHEMDQWRYAIWINKVQDTYNGNPVLVMIKLNEPFFINFSSGIIGHPLRKFTRNKTCKAVNWRFHDRFNRLTLKSLALKMSSVFVINKTNCLKEYGSSPSLSGLGNLQFLCLNFFSAAEDKDLDCMGADGSSLICKDNDLLFPAGIAIKYFGGSKCNRFDVANVFLDLGAYYDWIDSLLREHF